jgi:hypothetical protein
VHFHGPKNWRPRTIIHWVFTGLAAFLAGVILEENVRYLAAERHWNEFLSKGLAAVPDLAPLLETKWFWWTFGVVCGVAGYSWVIKFIPGDKPSTRTKAIAIHDLDKPAVGEESIVDPNVSSSSPTPASPAIASKVPSALRRHYEEDDRKRLSVVLYDLYTLLNESVSPPQLKVHEILRALPYRLHAEGSESIKNTLAELRSVFSTARDTLIEQFMQGNHYYADEIQDITSNRDHLNAEIVALDNYISVIDVIAETTPDRLSMVLEPYNAAVRDANFDLGSWVGRCNERIKAKRNELQ